eukprot:scaffold8016_cov62-Phaeocystis_antarctica.AAC.2
MIAKFLNKQRTGTALHSRVASMRAAPPLSLFKAVHFRKGLGGHHEERQRATGASFHLRSFAACAAWTQQPNRGDARPRAAPHALHTACAVRAVPPPRGVREAHTSQRLSELAQRKSLV